MATLAEIAQINGLASALGGKAASAHTHTAAQITDLVIPVVTPWVAYTPTIVGLGTVSNIIFRSRRVGSNLEIRGTFTSGTHTAVNATMTLGFNGTNGGITVADWITSRQVAGNVVISATTASSFYLLSLAGDGLLNFSIQSNGTIGLTPTLGSGIQNTLNFAIIASIPIQGW